MRAQLVLAWSLMVWSQLYCVDGQVSCTDQELPAKPVDIKEFGGRWRNPHSVNESKNKAHTHRDSEDGDWGCKCVHRHACRRENREEQCDYHGGQNIIDIRVYRPALAKECPNSHHVCCPYEHVVGNRSASCPEPGCGVRHPDGVGFCVIGDSLGDAEFGEFPWMAAVAVLRRDGVRYQCGGSLIDARVVLTAGHCVQGLDPSDLVVRLGEWDAQSTSEPHPHQDLLVTSIELHEEYTTDTLYNDIALIFLSTPVKRDKHIASICLPDLGTTFDGSRCFVTGWGHDAGDHGGGGLFRSVLKKFDVPIVSRSQCQTSLRKTRLGGNFKLHESFICAGAEPGRDACTGDGGGPLVCPLLSDPAKWQLAGIVAWGIGCGEDQTPAVYVDVAQFRPWIDKKLAEKNINSFSYTP